MSRTFHLIGENLLHTSVKANGLESVLFLLSARVDTSRVAMDGSSRSALHYAANVDNELILRNLVGACSSPVMKTFVI